MKKILALGSVLFLLLTGAFAEEIELDKTQSSLLKYAMEQQSQFINLMNSEVLWEVLAEPEDARSLFEQLREASPKAAILLSTKNGLSLDSQEVTEGIPAAVMPNICFNRMYYATSSGGDWSLARLSAEIALLDSTNISEIPAISYVVFLYSTDAPQIVTAFVRMPSGGVITYTTFVYVPVEHRIDGDGFFASEVFSHWSADIFDLVILKPLPSLE